LGEYVLIYDGKIQEVFLFARDASREGKRSAAGRPRAVVKVAPTGQPVVNRIVERVSEPLAKVV
jgi:hypothetical protein